MESVESAELGFERSDRLLQHPPMRIGSRGVAVRASARERQFERPATIACVALFGRQRAPQCFRALGFGLLELDVLALKTASHKSILPGWLST